MADMTPINTASAAPITGSAVLTAIAKAMGEMKRVAKDNKNTEQRYDFASVDDFLAMTGPICAANGIVTLMDEVSVENFEKAGKYGPTHWARYVFYITTYHASGEALPTVRRSVEVIRSGAQAAGSAQSYALKQYQRALYQIPTGDKDDPDHGNPPEPQGQPQGQQPRQQPRQKPQGQPPQGQPPQGQQPQGQQPQGQQPPRQPQGQDGPGIEVACNALDGAASLDQLKAIWTDLPDDIRSHGAVKAAKDRRKAHLETRATVGEDEIPY